MFVNMNANNTCDYDHETGEKYDTRYKAVNVQSDAKLEFNEYEQLVHY